MKRGYRLLVCGAAVAMALTGMSCARRVDNSKETREAYEKTLQDSISNIKVEIDSINNRIDLLRDQVADRMRNFTTVSNPREVGSYMIFTSFASKYPLSTTGLVSRIDDNGQFQLVATLAGGNFDQIVVKSADESAESAVVPNDQALNYRTESLNTVMFSGAAADSIGMLIADNELNPITVIYMANNPVRAAKLDGEQVKMISQTYALYAAQRDLSRLERRVPMLQEKINLIRIHKDKEQ